MSDRVRKTGEIFKEDSDWIEAEAKRTGEREDYIQGYCVQAGVASFRKQPVSRPQNGDIDWDSVEDEADRYLATGKSVDVTISLLAGDFDIKRSDGQRNKLAGIVKTRSEVRKVTDGK